MRVFYFILLCYSLTMAQVVTWQPVFPTADDTITIVFNAKEGNGALQGASTVYAHTGVITDKSPNSTYWLYVKADWSTNLPQAQMTNIGEDLWQIRFHIRSFYSVPQNEEILQLAFVFRNSNGSLIAKTADEQDIYIPVYETGLNVTVVSPSISPYYINPGDSAVIITKTTHATKQELYLDETLLTDTQNDSLHYVFKPQDFGVNNFTIVATDSGGSTKSEQFIIGVISPVTQAPLPQGVRDGINITGPSSATLVLTAPFKSFVYVIGSFNDWTIHDDYYMNQTPDSTQFWLELEGLDPSVEYSFQYLVNGSLRIADPYTEKVLDPSNDSYIDQATYPDLQPYPAGKTSEIVSTFQLQPQSYEFTITDFTPPGPEDLVIYELLIRDFVAEHTCQALIDTLDYFVNLGINAIELMPVNEFEGNSSWGYNPSFYFAPDKYYGTKNQLKAFIDAAHARGIAVIQDIVLNHAYGQCPMVRLYGDNMENSPWFNKTAPHTDFSWGYDFDHESEYTQAFVDSVLTFWMTEYQMDGFRFDFTRGFTNKSGSSGAYDASRMRIIKRIADHMWSVDSTAFVILEHLVDDNREYRELSDYGALLWGNMNHAYCQNAMGYDDGIDLSWAYAPTRGLSDHHLVSYMESHDEERMMFKNLEWGNAFGSYNVRNLNTALKRCQAAAAFFFPIPGPKMMWMFGELGYDYSIDYNGRLGEKPIKWDYYSETDRRQLYDVYAAIIKLRQLPAFKNGTYSINLSTLLKTIHIDHESMNVVIVGNFDVSENYIIPNFQNTGTWYDYLSGSLIDVSQAQSAILLAPGEFHIYTDVPLEKPVITSVHEGDQAVPNTYRVFQNHPNPFNASTCIDFSTTSQQHVTIDIFNIMGQQIVRLYDKNCSAGRYSIHWNGTDSAGNNLGTGVYYYTVKINNQQFAKKMLLLK